MAASAIGLFTRTRLFGMLAEAAGLMLTQPPQTAREWFQRGYEEQMRGDFERARAAFEAALTGDYGTLPAYSRAGAFRALGELAEHRGDVESAIFLYRQALNEDHKVGVGKRLAALERGPRRNRKPLP